MAFKNTRPAGRFYNPATNHPVFIYESFCTKKKKPVHVRRSANGLVEIPKFSEWKKAPERKKKPTGYFKTDI